VLSDVFMIDISSCHSSFRSSVEEAQQHLGLRVQRSTFTYNNVDRSWKLPRYFRWASGAPGNLGNFHPDRGLYWSISSGKKYIPVTTAVDGSLLVDMAIADVCAESEETGRRL
jgi:hypothetical protein